jgi:hypothetical protein
MSGDRNLESISNLFSTAKTYLKSIFAGLSPSFDVLGAREKDRMQRHQENLATFKAPSTDNLVRTSDELV